ncbi:MAG: S-adenosylmethionine:tRNA ribosyltransferase-isomerase, partial [Candidatus Tectomicrobia bacterium]
MQLQDFDFTLPPELIAQTPVARRDQSRLMIVDRARESIAHDVFANIGH